ncbi:MAG: VanZ family protein [Bacillota bacterium]|nr:VanZ family protein [Desulforamulus profundi]
MVKGLLANLWKLKNIKHARGFDAMSLGLWVTRSIIRVLPLSYMIFIWFLSSQPSHSVIDLGFYDSLIKESLHLVEFAILYGLLVLAFLTGGPLSPRENKIAIIISVAYAFVDEFHQSFIPSRSASVIDLIKDTAGVALVWFFIKQTYFRKEQSKIGRFLSAITDRLAPEAGQHGSK